MDIRSLYRNIPHKEGIKAVETTLKRKIKSTRVVTTLLLITCYFICYLLIITLFLYYYVILIYP